MQCKQDNVIKIQLWPLEASKPGACPLLIRRKKSQRGGAAGASACLRGSFGEMGEDREGSCFSPGLGVTCRWQVSLHTWCQDTLSLIILASSFLPGSLQCGLVLRPPGAPGPAFGGITIISIIPNLLAAFNSPPLWKPLSLPLALLPCPPDSSSSSCPIWNLPSVPIISVLVQQRAQS